MPRTPPHDGEQPETLPTIQQTRRHRYKYTASLRSRLSHSDEDHPEIPRIRRASLSPAENQVARPRPSPVHRRAERVIDAIEAGADDAREQEQEEVSELPETGKIVITPRRRTQRIYEPPPSTQRRIRRHLHYKPARSLSYVPLLSRILPLPLKSHHLILPGILSALLVMLFLIFIMINTFHDVLTRTPVIITRPGQGTQSASRPLATGSGQSAGQRNLVIKPTTTDHPPPPVYASAAYVLDVDSGDTLYAHNPFTHLPMLSTTKLMTALIAAEQGRPDQTITINDTIAHDLDVQLSADSALMGVKKGETYTLRDLLYGALLVSGNDACIVIADGLAGNVPNFVAKMNARAKELGMNDTHFMNPHGLMEKDHYSSAHDLAILGKYSLSNPLVHEISGTKEYKIPQTDKHAAHDLFNGNQFLWWYPGVDGGKPGWDGRKNFNQVVSVVRNHRHLIGVTLNTIDWWTDMRDLMNWGFGIFDWVSPYDADLQHPIPFDVDWDYFSRDKKENTIPTGDGGRYYIYTGYSVSDPILAYFDKNEGLKKFGFPRSMPVSTDTVVAQKFDHGTIRCEIRTKACQSV